MRRVLYPPDGQDGFTADEISRDIHLIYTDLECSACGFSVSLANFTGDEAVCPRCGDGARLSSAVERARGGRPSIKRRGFA